MKRIAGLFITAIIASLTTITIYKSFDDQQVGNGLLLDNKEANQKNIFHYANLPISPEVSVDFTDASQKTINAVVHVKTVYKGQTTTYVDPFYEFLWGGGNDKHHQYKNPDRHGSGSGVIISSDGFIVTNNHVINGADNIEVTLNNQRTYNAKVVGMDPSTDIALIKINETDLPSIRFGNSDLVRVGEWALAVGNPYNLTSTVTAGIVSAKGRNIDILRDKFKIESFIQTDAAVNPGNSGGALVNTNGELIGINSAIASPTGSYSGYSFAIPVNMVKKVVIDLQEFGEVQRAFIGVTIQNMNEQIADELGLNEISGVLINGIIDNGNAKQEKVKKGDIIKGINQVKISNVPELQEQIGRHRPGDKVIVIVLRDGKRLSLPIVLKNRFGNTNIVKDRHSKLVLHGATFEPINEKQMKNLNTSHGVQITKLDPGKLKNSGIKEGFIIIRIDKKNVENPEEVVIALDNKKEGILIEAMYPHGMRAYYGFGI